MEIAYQPKWMFSVSGEPDDIEFAVYYFNEFENDNRIRIGENSGNTVIWSKSWEFIENIDDFYEVANGALRFINGAQRLTNNCRNIGLVNVFKRNGNGKYDLIVQATMTVAPPRSMSIPDQEFHKILKAASGSEHLLSALEFFGMEQNWYNIYKCIEALRDHYKGEGDNYEALLNKGFIGKKVLKKTYETASYHRHYLPNKTVDKPVSLNQARKNLRDLIERAFEHETGVKIQRPFVPWPGLT